MATREPPREPALSGGAAGGIVFAACVLTLVGVFQVIAGLTAIFDDEFFVVTRDYTFDLDTTAWGWLHLLIGLLLVVTGFGLFGRRTWAVALAIALALLSAVANFFFIPYFPVWSVIVIALNIWVIWSLTRAGAIRT
jgi:hypothetical protein